MNKLNKTYKQDGFSHEVCDRVNDVALVAKYKGNVPRGYEVIKIQQHEGFTIAGKVIPAAEHPPRSEDWGTKGWTFTDKESAIEKFKELTV